jgi:DNA modification methylase
MKDKNKQDNELNKLIHGDCLEALRELPTESVDLIYLDPPFFTNKQYEVLWGDSAEKRSFDDRWAGGINHFLEWLYNRVKEMYRVLKPTGSFYLHCDWHANAYIRVDVLDKIFGRKCFRNEIIWKRNEMFVKSSSKKFDAATDTIFWYSKSNNYTYNIQSMRSERDPSNSYKLIGEDGRIYQSVLITGHKTLKSPQKYMYEYKGYTPEYGWNVDKNKLKELDKQGLLIWKDGVCKRYKKYLDDREEKINSLWYDIVSTRGKEHIGWKTQKPEALLERIILASSNKGDIVLDPFLGGGTTVAVAERLGRKWIGIDISAVAVKVTELRLNKFQGIFEGSNFEIKKQVYDYDILRNKDAFEFEGWIVQQFGGEPNIKQHGDSGIDGKMPDGTPIQVKRSDNISRNVIDNFQSAVKRANKNLYEENIKNNNPIGYLIAFSFGKGVKEEISRLRLKDGVIIELVEVKDIVPIAKKPHINIKVLQNEKNTYELVFIATSDVETKIESYNWQFDYNESKGGIADVLVDEEGRQVKKFDKGTYIIAVQAVDKNLMTSDIFTIKVKVNGGISISH